MKLKQTPRAAALLANQPSLSGQIEFSEDERLRKLIEETGRNRSYVTRAAILLLLKQHEAGLIDWSKGAEQW
jgi:hypothetical protein